MSIRQRQLVRPTIHPPESDTEPEAQQLNGPITEVRSERTCTDLACFTIFTFLILCLVTLSAFSWANGFPGRLTRGSDFYGDPCGFGSLSSLEYTYFLNPDGDIEATLCLPGCPANSAADSICLYNSSHVPMLDYMCFDSYASKPFFNSYCLPADYSHRKKVVSYLYNSERTMSRVVGDLARVRGMALPLMILSGVGASFLLAVMCFLVYEESPRINSRLCGNFGPVEMVNCNEGRTATGYEALCWVLLAVSILALSSLLCMYSSLKSSLDFIRRSSRAAAPRLPQFIVPLVAVIFGVGIYAYFIVLAVYQSSCGDTHSAYSRALPFQQTNSWYYYESTRVLTFFTILMLLWCFSVVAHIVEFVTAGGVMFAIFHHGQSGHPSLSALKVMTQFHLGSVFLAAMLVPLGRLPRNALLGLQRVVTKLLPRAAFMFKMCDAWYEEKFKFMTSDGLAYQTFIGKGLFSSFKESNFLLTRHEANKHPQSLLNNANYYVWLSQLLITMVAPVFTGYWIHFERETFQGVETNEVTSVTAMSFFALFFSWFLAQVYGGFLRGLIHAQMIAYLIDAEGNATARVVPNAIREMMGEDVIPTPRKRVSMIQRVEKPPGVEDQQMNEREEQEVPYHSEDSSIRQ